VLSGAALCCAGMSARVGLPPSRIAPALISPGVLWRLQTFMAFHAVSAMVAAWRRLWRGGAHSPSFLEQHLQAHRTLCVICAVPPRRQDAMGRRDALRCVFSTPSWPSRHTVARQTRDSAACSIMRRRLAWRGTASGTGDSRTGAWRINIHVRLLSMPCATTASCLCRTLRVHLHPTPLLRKTTLRHLLPLLFIAAWDGRLMAPAWRRAARHSICAAAAAAACMPLTALANICAVTSGIARSPAAGVSAFIAVKRPGLNLVITGLARYGVWIASLTPAKHQSV